jgi:hypothetical protein
MSEILMVEARSRDLNGKVFFVQAPGQPLQPGHLRYYSQYDKDKLRCPCCEAKVIFRAEVPSVAGSTFKGRSAHFALSPGQKHDAGCEIPTRPSYERHVIPNRMKGYRIHINTLQYSELFNNESGVYGRGPNGRIEIRDPDMRDRERKVINTAAELVEFLKVADYKRINDSRIVFKNQPLDWDEFFVRPNQDKGHERFVELLERLEGLKKGEETFCAMIVRVEKGKTLNFSDRTVKGMRLPIARKSDDGVSETIAPQIFINNMNNTHLTWGFQQPGDYLVMGVPTLKTRDYHNDRMHYMGVRVENPDAVQRVDLQEILTIRKTKGRHPVETAAPQPETP